MVKLGALLAEDDVQAISLWNTSATVLRDLFDGHAPPFEAALAAFDFAAADALLRRRWRAWTIRIDRTARTTRTTPAPR